MLNFEQLVKRATTDLQDKPLVAAPYSISHRLFERMANDGVISGYVAEDIPNGADPVIRGWWVDRREGIWFIRPSFDCHTLLFLSGSAENEFSGRMLLEARLKGIRRILFVGEDGSITQDIDVASAVLERLQRAPI